MSTVLAEPVQLPTPTVPIDGLYYPVRDREAIAGAMLLHGNVGNFYRGPSAFLPPALLELGVCCLAMNRRGHDVVATIGRDPEGGAYQSTDEGIEDAAIMAAHLSERGHQLPIVIGHSHGGVLATALAARLPVRALVLISAHAGGPGSVARDSRNGLLALDRVEHYLERARQLLAEGRGDELLVLPAWWHAISAASLLDRLENTPDLLELAAQVTSPTLTLRGGNEDETSYPMGAVAEEVAKRSPETTEFEVVPGAGHHYVGYEQQLATRITAWMRRILP